MLFNSLDYILFDARRGGLLDARPSKFIEGGLHFLRVMPVLYGLESRVYCIDPGVDAPRLQRGARHFAAPTQKAKKRWLMVSLAGNLGLLGTFKYYNFFASAVGDTLGLFGLSIQLPFLDVLLPVGISFYTFQTMSYTIDLYRGNIEPTRNFFKFAFYVTFFLSWSLGRLYAQFSFCLSWMNDQSSLVSTWGKVFFLIGTGLIKKVAIADYLAVNLVDRVFDNPEAFTAVEVLLGLYGYTAQIYCDFSGYTDVARGSAMLLGFRISRTSIVPIKQPAPPISGDVGI